MPNVNIPIPHSNGEKRVRELLTYLYVNGQTNGHAMAQALGLDKEVIRTAMVGYMGAGYVYRAVPGTTGRGGSPAVWDLTPKMRKKIQEANK